MISNNKYLISSILIALFSGYIFTKNIIYLILIIALIIRIILLKDLNCLVIFIVLSVAFLVRTNLLPQRQNDNYDTIIIKINPSELHESTDFYSGIAGNKSEKFSYLINKDFKKLDIKDNRIIYLKTSNFELNDIKGPTNIAEKSFKKYYFTRGVYRKLIIRSFDQIQCKPISIIDKILLQRYKMKNRFKKLSPTLRFNAINLLIGDSENDEDSKMYKDDFSKVGIIHMFSLSGMHLVFLIVLLKKIFSYSRILTNESVELLLCIILPIYMIFVGGNTGICRATILVLTKIIIKKMGIYKSRTEIFGISMIIGLFFDPKCLFLLGGQLTYLLSFALIYLHGKSFIKLTVIMNMLSMPILIFNNYELNLLSVPLNIIMAPIFEYFILPSTIITGLLGNINLLENINKSIYAILHNISSINLFQIVFGKLNIITLFALVMCGLIIITDKKHNKLFLKLYLILIIGSILVNKFPIKGQVTFIDVGQGDSILITTPIFRHTYLIDTGGKLTFGKTNRKTFNVDKITIPYLKYQGISKIDAIFLSHQDADHIGDLRQLLRMIPIKEIYIGEGMQSNPKIRNLLMPYSKFIRYKTVIAGDQLDFNDISFKVLSPIKPGMGNNEDSMVLETNICNKTWLFTGDLNREKELEIIKNNNLKIDYLKVGHHGSKTSSDPEFIKQIHPEIAFISVGKKNRYGHPNNETINTLKTNNVKILKTSDCGMIKWNYGINDYKIETFFR